MEIPIFIGMTKPAWPSFRAVIIYITLGTLARHWSLVTDLSRNSAAILASFCVHSPFIQL